MAIAASTLLQVRQSGSDTANGGGFDPANANMAADLAATVANTSAPVVTSASYNFVAGDVGAWLYIKSGTNWTPGWYPIVSVASNAATLDAAIGHVSLAGMSLSTVVGCASVASPSSGTWAIDYSQQNAPQFAYTDLVIDGTTNTKATSAAHPFTVAMAGNIVAVTGGTGFTVQRVQIVSVTSGAATMDKSLGTVSSTGGTGGLGGAFASPGGAMSIQVTGIDMAILGGTPYLATSASTNVAGGCVSVTGGATATNASRIIGHNGVMGDRGARAVLQASGISTATLWALGTGTYVECLEADGANLTSIRGFSSASGQSRAYKCKAQRCTNNGINSSSAGIWILCEVTTCTTSSAVSGGLHYKCSFHDNAVSGFVSSSTSVCIQCISENNTGTSDGFFANSAFLLLIGCTARANGRNGVRMQSASNITYSIVGGVFYGNTSNDIDVSGATDGVELINCARGTLGASIAAWQDMNPITLTADPFTNAAGNDFSLNSTAGGGLLAKGIAETFLGLSSTSHHDLGAVQHGDPVSGGGTRRRSF
jgi:hypothetical protein